jgi:hypothetical protein
MKDVPQKSRGAQRLRTLFWCIVILLGLLQTWAARHQMNPDGIAYLDMGDAWWRGDWKTAINGYWSPLYACVVGLVLRILNPSPYWEFSVVHLVNFVIYLAAFWSFDFFWRAMLDRRRMQTAERSAPGEVTWPAWAWLMLGYTLFIWSSTFLVDVATVSPDLSVAALVYLGAGLLLRIREGRASWLTFALFGAVLGLAYLAKTAMFPMAFVFLAVSLFCVRPLRSAAPRVGLALATFLVVVSPFIMTLSRAKGRLTIGDSGKLVYAFGMDDRVNTGHWHGEVAGSGTPRHGPKKTFDVPAVYEFATSSRVTDSRAYDPSYWHEGLRIQFNLKRQIVGFAWGLLNYYHLFFELQATLVTGVLILFWMSRKGGSGSGGVARNWHILIPAAAAMGMYSLIAVQPRYVGPFMLLFWAALLSRVRLPESPESRRLLASVTVATTVMIGCAVARSTVPALSRLPLHLPHTDWEVAEGLKTMGVQAGDKVAYVGATNQAFWARLGRVRIIAEIPDSDAARFWEADSSVRSKVLEVLARPGAKALITEKVPRSVAASRLGWVRIGKTDYYAHPLAATVLTTRPS